MSVRTGQLKDPWKEQRLFLSRIIGAAAVVLALTGVLIWRLVHLQVVDYQRFNEMAQGNQIRIESLAPARGLVYDRKGRILAENVPTWQLVAIPEQIEDLDVMFGQLEALGLLDPADRDALIDLVRSHRRFEPVTLANLSEVQAATFAVRRHHFPGINVQEGLIRYYRYGPAAAHAVGYVGSISASDLAGIDRADYAGTFQIGKTGVERAYEDQLHGGAGYRQQVANAQGRIIFDASSNPDAGLEERLPEPGRHVHLTLDVELQLAAYEALSEVRGAAVAIDPRNGEVLTLVSTPAFDPNLFARGLSGDEFVELNTDPDLPLFNRALAGRYPPGSTVKPFYGLAGLHYEAEHVAEDHICFGEFRLPGSSRVYREGPGGNHGEMSLHTAIVRSCNVYFYGLAVELGIDRMEQFMKSFGFGAATGIDISGEGEGLMPSRQWKRDYFSDREQQSWYQGETVSTGIGQGYTEVTPLQLAHATATLAVEGLRFQPQLLVSTEDAKTGLLVAAEATRLASVEDVDPTHWQAIRDAMLGVTSEARGTALSSMNGTSFTVGGKTGTAQVVGVAQDEEYDEEAVEERFRDNGLFIAFAPVENPEIAIAVVVENNGGGGRTAAPVARTILDTFFGGNEYVAQRVRL
ncbi:MAG TPA: penicillin-binding protein 2 [Gammaproteobacteria bacterium]|jgi:penicillin-binding protein 2